MATEPNEVVRPDGSVEPMFPELRKKRCAEVSVTFRHVADLSAHMRKVFDEIRSDTRTYGTQVTCGFISVTLEYDKSFGVWILIAKEEGKSLLPPESFMPVEGAVAYFTTRVLPILYDRERSRAVYDPDS